MKCLLLLTSRMRSSSRKGTSAARLMASSSVLLKPVTWTITCGLENYLIT